MSIVESEPNDANEDPFEPKNWLNHYKCPRCGNAWDDLWSCTCDDDCPACGCRHISPDESTWLGDEEVDELYEPVMAFCPMCDTENEPMGALGNLIHYRCRACGMVYCWEQEA